MREALAAAALAALLAGPAGTPVKGEKLIREAARPPRSAGASVLRSISPSALAVALPDGNRVRFWPARRVAPARAPEPGSSPFLRERVSYRIAPGSLVGLIEFSEAWTDSREQAIPAGVYALVYAVQPAIKEHRGVSELRDALVLVPAREFDASEGIDALVEASRRVSGTGHPAVLALLPPSSPADRERASRDERGRFLLQIRSGGVPMALILFGAKSLQTRGFDPRARVPDNQGRNAGRAALSTIWNGRRSDVLDSRKAADPDDCSRGCDKTPPLID